MTMRGVFALNGITRLANEAESEFVQLNALKTVLTDAMRVARGAGAEIDVHRMRDHHPPWPRLCKGGKQSGETFPGAGGKDSHRRGPFRRGDELAKRVKKLPIFPVLSLSQKRPLRTAKVMAHWRLWRGKRANRSGRAVFWWRVARRGISMRC